jgi:uncharacterized membrane protein YphA (DoxX/SURF4 family)
MGPFVGGVEIGFGLLMLLGCLTRLSTIPLLFTMAVVMLSTKIPVLLGQGFWGIFAEGTAALWVSEYATSRP